MRLRDPAVVAAAVQLVHNDHPCKPPACLDAAINHTHVASLLAKPPLDWVVVSPSVGARQLKLKATSVILYMQALKSRRVNVGLT